MTGLDSLLGRADALNSRVADVGAVAAVAAQQRHFLEDPSRSQAIKDQIASAKGHNGGFRNFAEFCMAVRVRSDNQFGDSAVRDHCKTMMGNWENLFNSRYKSFEGGFNKTSPTGMSETFSGQDGGALVPPEFVAQILMRLYSNDLMNRCTIFPVAGNQLKVPAINETSRAEGSRFGGVTSYWLPEAGTINPSKPSIQTVDLSLESLFVMMRPTQQLLDDAPALEVYLTTLAAQEVAFKVGSAIVRGDGVGKPKGILNSNCKVAVTKESGQLAATIKAENIMNMWARLHESCEANAIWLVEKSTFPQLSSMTIGTAGAQLAVYLPQGGLSNTPYGTIYGRPVIPVEFCSALGTEGDIILWDPTQYLIITKGGIQTAVSMHLYFNTNEMAFRFTMRMDGKNWWTSALTPFSGAATRSCVVTLETRS